MLDEAISLFTVLSSTCRICSALLVSQCHRQRLHGSLKDNLT